MSVKEVRDYYMRMTSDYIELKQTLEKLESEITPETSAVALQNIDNIRKQCKAVQENYNRINYIMYLLDMPKNNKKKQKWSKQEKRRLESIPEEARLPFIQKENKAVISNLKKYINC